jgi:hypothetical protein
MSRALTARAARRCLLLLVVLLAAVEALGAESSRIQEGLVVNSQTELLLYFRVDGAVSPEMAKGILTGIPVTFAFFVELHEHPPGKGAVQVANRNFSHTLHFDTLKEEFSLELTEHGKESFIFHDFAAAATALSGVHDLAVANLALLKPGLDYTVKMKAQLAKQGLPEKFKNVMTFLKIWDFETRWSEIRFTMPPAAAAGH